MVLGLTAIAAKSSATAEPMYRKIVVFKSGVEESVKEALINKFDGEKIKDLGLINGKAARLTAKAEKDLVRQPGVLRIDDDVVVEALVRNDIIAKRAPSQPAETLPWGVDRIDAEKVWAVTTGDLVKVAVIDTGIDVFHPDLKDNIKGGMSAVAYTASYNDDNGHGTHEAGIIGAIDNTIGVIGVGHQIDLYAVKVLDRRGSGYLSDIIEGLDWAISNGMQVVNMSLGTASNILSFREAVQRVNAAGIVQVAAAGNSGGSVIYPAAYPEVIAVSATDSSDKIASWSSRGPEVDLSAPGVSIYSTYKGQIYKTLSGTSMAAPHVTGVIALMIDRKTCDYDLNGICTPAEVQQKLEATAEDLGVVGKDNLYGAGLIDAEKAIIQ
ncbi:MAG: putative subtilisin [Parcubacteria group bacterium Athens1014_26]|nr:MAG: putative subtilisin [Parcubacteria group bacterium Athens1014_26]